MTAPHNPNHFFSLGPQCSDGHYPANTSSSFGSKAAAGIRFQVTEPEPEDFSLRGGTWPRIDEVIQVSPDQVSTCSQGLQLSSKHNEIDSTFKRHIKRAISADHDYLSIYESEDDLASPIGTVDNNDQTAESSFPPLTRQPAREDSPTNLASSTITHLHRTNIPNLCPIYTLHPDASFRADPHRRLRDHVRALNNHWTQTRDITLAAPFQLEWRAHESQLDADRKIAYVAHLRRQVKADNSKWFSPRKVYLRAKDWLVSRQQRESEARSREKLSARLNGQYVEAQLAQRRVLVEAQLSAAALEMYSGDRVCGRFLRDAWLRYLCEDAGRVFLPVRAEVPDVGIIRSAWGRVEEDVDDEEDRVPRWLEAGYQDIDYGDGRERFIVRFFG